MQLGLYCKKVYQLLVINEKLKWEIRIMNNIKLVL